MLRARLGRGGQRAAFTITSYGQTHSRVNHGISKGHRKANSLGKWFLPVLSPSQPNLRQAEVLDGWISDGRNVISTHALSGWSKQLDSLSALICWCQVFKACRSAANKTISELSCPASSAASGWVKTQHRPDCLVHLWLR